MKEKLYKTVQEICNRAFEGKLFLEEFFKIWPQEDQDDFLKVVFEDVEDAVEHLPASIFTKEIDWNTWKKSETYKNILIDRELLNLWARNPKDLVECHRVASKKKMMSEIEIKEFIETFMKREE